MEGGDNGDCATRRNERQKRRKKESDVYVMSRVTELTVCQPNTGSTVQLPLLFIPPVDSLAGIYARARDTPTQHLPHPLLPIRPTLCRNTPTRKSITYPTPRPQPRSFFINAEMRNLQKYPGAQRHQRGWMRNLRIDEIIHDTCQSIHFSENQREKEIENKNE